MCGRGLILLAALCAAHRPQAARAQEEERPVAVVLTVGEVDAAAALASARRAGGADYQSHSVRAAAPAEPQAPADMLTALRNSYLEADFLRCMVQSREDALNIDRLLSLGLRPAAAEAGVIGAACAAGAEDPRRATLMLRRLFAAELDLADALRLTGADFQAEVERVRAEVLSAPRVALTLRATPADAAVTIDGGSHGCETTPCTVRLLPGTHQITASRLGYEDRSVQHELVDETELAIALDPAPVARVREQLAHALHRGVSPGSAAFMRAAADAAEARVVIAVWEDRGRTHAALLDRARNRIVARISTRGEDAVGSAVRSAIREWRGINEPRPLVRHPAFWLGIIGAAAAAGLTVYFLLRPGDVQHDVVFGIR